MTMKVVAVGGPPATGKSTLVRKLMADYGPSWRWEYGLVKGERFSATPGHLWVLGRYDREFGGTDTLAMNVIDDAEALLGHLQSEHEHATVLFEGDRLFNERYLRACLGAADAFHGYVLQAPDHVLETRHDTREDGQSAAWLKGRTTKYHNLLDTELPLEPLQHVDTEDLEQAYHRLISHLPEPA